MNKFLQYFIHRPAVTNVIMFGMILSAIIFWQKIGKEEMPEFAMEWVRVSIKYPGASAQDVELFVTKPIEEKLKSITGIKEVVSTSAYSSSSFRITLEPRIENLTEKIQEIKDAIDTADLPSEVDDPVYRQFRSSEKAIIDIGVYLKNQEILDIDSRVKLQSYVLAFKNKMLSLSEISGMELRGYLKPEIQIKVDPQQLKEYEISMNEVKNQIQTQHIRRPLGSLEDKSESEVVVLAELNNPLALKDVVISSNFAGPKIFLSDLAKIENGFEKNQTIIKIQGHEGILLNIQKSSKTDILTAKQAVVDFIESFKKTNPDQSLDFVLIDDESYDVQNRLSLITTNGIIGFILIILILFLFLDFRSGFWVSMGIPFSLAFTLLAMMVFDYTINNITLAAIIVVLGIVVDDAIIVAENIDRKAKSKTSLVSKATEEVFHPIMASILTTCAAFLPLYFFSGRFGLLVKYIPLVVILMLVASLFESFFILPSHLSAKKKTPNQLEEKIAVFRYKILNFLERNYLKLIHWILLKRIWAMAFFTILLVVSGYLYQHHLKYVMFPREESRDFRIKAIYQEDINRYEMAKKIRPIENIFIGHPMVTSVDSSVGQNRRGGEVRENEASITVEILPPSERDQSLNELLENWQKDIDQIKGFEKIQYQKSRFGSDSGSPIVIEVQENNDAIRKKIVEKLKESLEKIPDLTNVEIERPVLKDEYQLLVKKNEVSRLGVNYQQLASILRSYVEGDILYILNDGDEEVDVRLTSLENYKNNIDQLLNSTIANQQGYLVKIKDLVSVNKIKKSANIQRVQYRRSTVVYADMVEERERTPLEIAEFLEKNIFPELIKTSITANIVMRGEVEDTRESQGDFLLSIVASLLIIFVLLVFLFNSITIPLLIKAVLPFAGIGSVLAFWFHGYEFYGFFAVVGILGMLGVVINDSIVLVDQLQASLNIHQKKLARLFDIGKICTTRLRAVILTTMTTVAGLFPTAYGIGGYDSMLAEMMFSMGWGLLFGMGVTLVLVPCLYSFYIDFNLRLRGEN